MTEYKLVPIEPTEEMMMNEATCQHHAPFDMSCVARSNRMRIWKAMLSAAPQPQPIDVGQFCGIKIYEDEKLDAGEIQVYVKNKKAFDAHYNITKKGE